MTDAAARNLFATGTLYADLEGSDLVASIDFTTVNTRNNIKVCAGRFFALNIDASVLQEYRCRSAVLWQRADGTFTTYAESAFKD